MIPMPMKFCDSGYLAEHNPAPRTKTGGGRKDGRGNPVLPRDVRADSLAQKGLQEAISNPPDREYAGKSIYDMHPGYRGTDKEYRNSDIAEGVVGSPVAPTEEVTNPDKAKLPVGIGGFHTHYPKPGYEQGQYRFSPEDKYAAYMIEKPEYIATPDGTFKRYDPPEFSGKSFSVEDFKDPRLGIVTDLPPLNPNEKFRR
jgi:hypothetical protein